LKNGSSTLLDKLAGLMTPHMEGVVGHDTYHVVIDDMIEAAALFKIVATDLERLLGVSRIGNGRR
jgi:hypothetical protein